MLDELEHELERVRASRSDVAGPDDATVAATRAELMDAMGPEPPAASASARRRPGRERLRKLRRRRRFVLAGGLATVGVGIAGALGLTTAATPVSALAAQMNRLANVAASQDWTGIPGPGQYIYTESDTQYDTDAVLQGGSCDITKLDHRQIWIATDGSGALDETFSDPQFTSAADQQQCASAGITDPAALIKGASGGERFPAGGLSLPTNDWKSFSTDPQTLLTQVHQQDGGPDTPAEWFTNVADFMRESDVPPVIRAALYQATALIPGVRVLGSQTTMMARQGLASPSTSKECRLMH